MVNLERYQMPFIQNVGKFDAISGRHQNPGGNSMLIQIMDPASEFPRTKHTFKEVHQFEFLDVERDDRVFEECWRISDDQAIEIVRLLNRALENDMNVIVHCHMGICRSGAVAEVGVMMGFRDTDTFRQPNLLVKHKLMRVLGLTYDEEEVTDYESWRNMKFEGEE